jgi:dipeptidase E
MPIVLPPNLSALGLVSFQINPHYFPGPTFFRFGDGFQELCGETRDERIQQFHELNEPPVVGLWEGGMLAVEANGVTLLGAPARVFRKGREPVDMEPGNRIDQLLSD